MNKNLFTIFVICMSLISYGSNAEAHRLQWTQTADKFISTYKVTIAVYPEEYINNAIPWNNCLDCKVFEKIKDISKYQDHLSKVTYWKEYESRYTYYRDYVGYDVFREHIAEYHKDKNYITSKVYVNPVYYRTQNELTSIANEKDQILTISKKNVDEHIKYIRDKIDKFIS